MYGKIFKSMYKGSMFGSDPLVFAVWGYVLANAYDSMIELHPKYLSAVFNSTHQDIEEAIRKLTAPDRNSRHKEHEGRRLVHVRQFYYEIPSWKYYQTIASEEARREYMRNYMRDYRVDNEDSCKQGLTPVNNSKQNVNNVEVDVDVDKDNNIKPKKRTRKKFVAPTLEEVVQYQKEFPELGNIDAKFFWNYFNDGDWHDSNGKAVKNWKQKFRAWSNHPNNQGQTTSTQTQGKTRLFPITGKSCSKKGCHLPACYKDARGEYDSFYCGTHMPDAVKEKFYG